MDNKNNGHGRTLVDMLVEHTGKALLVLFAMFAGIYFLGKSGIGVEIPSIIKTRPAEQQMPESSVEDAVQEVQQTDNKQQKTKTSSARQKEPERATTVEQHSSTVSSNVQKNEKEKKAIRGSLDFQTPPNSEYYFIKTRGQGDFQRVDESGNFEVLVDIDETVLEIDVYNEKKEKLTSKTVDCTTSNTIQIIIK